MKWASVIIGIVVTISIGSTAAAKLIASDQEARIRTLEQQSSRIDERLKMSMALLQDIRTELKALNKGLVP